MRLLIISLGLLFFAACNNNKDSGKKDPSGDTTTTKNDDKTDEQPPQEDNAVVGVWRPVEMSMEMSEEEKKDIMEKANIEFTPGGSYISNFEDTETGSYTYDPAAKTLVTVSPGKSEERFTVEWNNGQLKLTSIKGEGMIVLKRK